MTHALPSLPGAARAAQAEKTHSVEANKNSSLICCHYRDATVPSNTIQDQPNRFTNTGRRRIRVSLYNTRLLQWQIYHRKGPHGLSTCQTAP
jgi:hypothetical protein